MSLKLWHQKGSSKITNFNQHNYGFVTIIYILRLLLFSFRKGWHKKFVVKQVPSHITADIIPKMQSLPQVAKDILMYHENPHIDYENQMLIIRSDRNADSWHPTPEDIFAEDWELVIPPINK